MTVQLRFGSLGWPIISKLIQFTSGSWIEHVDIVINGVMYSALPGGVIKANTKTIDLKKSEYLTINVSQIVEEKLILVLEKQLGKPYDYFGLISFPFKPKWNNSNRWFCSELIAYALSEVGYIKTKKFYRISPKYLYNLVKS